MIKMKFFHNISLSETINTASGIAIIDLLFYLMQFNFNYFLHTAPYKIIQLAIF